MRDLTFRALREANVARLPHFRDRQGRLCHPTGTGLPSGYDWALSQWANAVCGELGEAANLIKKIERGDYTLSHAQEDLADELCDVITYVDLLAYRAGIDLDTAILRKWNKVSVRVGAPVRLGNTPSDPRTKKFYVGTQLANMAQAKEVRDLLLARKWIITFDWMAAGRVDDEAAFAQRGLGDLQGVIEADVVIIILPVGHGGSAELGAALASCVGDGRVRVVLWAPGGLDQYDGDYPSVFCRHPLLELETGGIFQLMARLEGKPALGLIE